MADTEQRNKTEKVLLDQIIKSAETELYAPRLLELAQAFSLIMGGKSNGLPIHRPQ